MKYTEQQRLDIGRRIYEGEITKYQAADIYDICDETARKYMRLYRRKNTHHVSVPAMDISHLNESAVKYTKEDRLDIGRRIYEGEITRYEAAERYNISDDTARRYMRQYRDSNHLPPKKRYEAISHQSSDSAIKSGSDNLEEYEAMSRDDLIRELVKARTAASQLRYQLSQIQVN